MSAPERRRYTIRDKQGAQWVGSLIAGLEPGWVVTISPATRSLPQNSIFHALVDEIAKARPEWAGMPMDSDSWKALLIVSHALATRGEKAQPNDLRLVPDLEGQGLVQLRESSARMSKPRATSLIDYVIAWATGQGIEITVPEPAQ